MDDFDLNEEDITLDLPGFGRGGFVRETGLALVHQGETIVPAADSRARIDALGSEERVVNYHFPVEIIVTGGLTADEIDIIEPRIWTRLSEALNATA